MVALLRASRRARGFIETHRASAGAYRITEWPAVRRRRPPTRPASARRTATRLRFAQRLGMGFLDPVEDAMFLTVGLRQLGHPASFHLGREITPAAPPAGLYAWVQCDGEVVSTSLPVAEEYVEIYRSTPEPVTP